MTIRVLKQSAETIDLLDLYEPPYGMGTLIERLRVATVAEAESLLRSNFAAAQTKALVGDMRRRNAAAELYVACKRAIAVDAEWRREHGDHIRTPEYQESYDMVLAAIQKAEA